MLSLDDLLKFAKIKNIPPQRRRGMLREYLQTLTLSYIQQTDFASKMIFIGGTALRFFYDLQRFSEDLDFNYSGALAKEDITKLMDHVIREFKKEGIMADFSIRKSLETYFHWKVYLQFPEVLQVYKCGGRKGHALHPSEKLSVQLDFQNLGKKKYPLSKKIISHFGKRFLFNTTDLDMFLAEKSNAILYRKIPRGRDFFDFMSLLLWGAKINFAYLQRRDIAVKNKGEYSGKILRRAKRLDFVKLADQLSPFLFLEEDKKIMRDFPSYLEDLMKKL